VWAAFLLARDRAQPGRSAKFLTGGEGAFEALNITGIRPFELFAAIRRPFVARLGRLPMKFRVAV
jgi:hypothetical protein